MQITKKNRDKLYNTIIISVLIAASLFIIGYIWYDNKKIEKHLQECKEICKPDEVVDSLSFDLCVCKKVVNLDDTI